VFVGGKRKTYVIHSEEKILKIIAAAKEIGNNLAIAEYYKVAESNIRRWINKYSDATLPSPDPEALKAIRDRRKNKVRFYADLENLLLDWIKTQRSKNIPLTQSGIRDKALRIYRTMPQYKRQAFKASPGWFYGFARAFSLVKRKGTHIMQKFPRDLNDKIAVFLDEVWGHRKFHSLTDGTETLLIGNMDEVPVFFDMQTGHTYHERGAKEIKILRTKTPKLRATVVLAVTKDGGKLPPFVVFKGSKKNVEAYKGNKAFFCSNDTGWMTSELCIEWIKKIWFSGPISKGQKRYLIWDSFSAHKNSDVLEFLAERNNVVSIIPGGCTPILQPLDYMINKPFKDLVKKKFRGWFEVASKESGEKVPTPPKNDFLDWIVESWSQISLDMISESFLKCGLSVSVDGKQGHLMNNYLKRDADLNEHIQLLWDAYVENEHLDEPYEDFPELKTKLREADDLTYEIEAANLKVIHLIIFISLKALLLGGKR
jgi:hypothetical protein